MAKALSAGEAARLPARVRCRVTGGRAAETDAGRGRFSRRYPRLHRALVALGLDRLRGAYRRAAQRRREARRQPDMAMYCVPRAEMVALVQSAGSQVLAVDEAPLAGGFKSGPYWVRVG